MQKALGDLRSMYSSSSAQTATHWTRIALRALLSTAQQLIASMVGGESPVMGSALQQRPHMKEARGPWEAAQHAQQQRRPNSHTLDRNSPQGPPVQSLAIRRLANLVAQEPPVMGAVQQHASCKKGICCGLL